MHLSIYIVLFSIYKYIYTEMAPYIYTAVYIIIYVYMENGTKGKWQLRLFAANGKRKQKTEVSFLGRQTINGNR
jgi:hypothetical protein